MTNAEKFRKIFKEFATEVWAFSEKDFLTWLNADYEESTIRNCFGCKYSKDNHNQAIEECHLCMWENQYTPTIKNDLGVEEVTALAEWTEKLTKECEEAYKKGYADGMKAQAEPKTGYWIADVDRWGDVVTIVNGYRCDKCNAFNSVKDNYCPNCGAKMESEA